jgi:hypothetical protein
MAMKSLTFKKDSWHYKAAMFVFDSWQIPNDLCGYVRHVIWGGLMFILLMSFCAALACGVGYLLCMWLHWLFQMISTMSFIAPSDEAVIVNVILGVIAACGAAILAIKLIVDYKNDMRQKRYEEGYVEPEPGFLRVAYRSFKDKTCFKINLV